MPRRLYAVSLLLAVGASLWGYNIGILSSILVHPGFGADLSAGARGAVAGIYYAGTLLSYALVAHPLADTLGRRGAALSGALVLAGGALLMAASRGLPRMVLGRFVCGVGVGVVSTSVPLYQSEVSPAKERGKFVTMNHVGFIAGLATGLWVGYAMSFWTGAAGDYWGWRTSILLQLVPAAVFCAGLPFIPESDSPRWLVEKGRLGAARAALHRLDAAPATALADMQQHCHTTRALFGSPALRARLWRALLLQFLGSLCGATAIKYYLPTLLRALGVPTRWALLAGAVEMTLKIGLTVVEMWLIDRVGRRWCLMGGSLVMGLAMLINGTLPLAYPDNVNRAADIVCIVSIFVYAMGYSLGLGPAAWVYSAEIFPTSVRARGLNLSAAGGSVGSILVSQVWPLGQARWGSRVYFFFMVVNLLCVPIIWFLYPETKGRALEDMDSLFGTPESLHVETDNDQSHDSERAALINRASVDEGAPLLS